MQSCKARLIRDVKFLATLSDPVARRDGHNLLTKIKGHFRIRHPEQMPLEKWERAARWTAAAEAVLHRAKHTRFPIVTLETAARPDVRIL